MRHENDEKIRDRRGDKKWENIGFTNRKEQFCQFF